MRTSSGLEPPAAMIPRAVHSLGKKVERLYRMHDAFRHLPELIGGSFAKHVKPLGIQQGRLFLYVPNATWRNEAWMFRTEIIRRINARMGEQAVKEIVFSHDRHPVGTVGTNAERGTGGGTQTQSRALQRVDLSEEELAVLRQSCAEVRNETLRDRFLRISIRQKQLEKLRLQEKWRPCRACGILCEPGREYCAACARQKRARTRQEVRELLREVPWLRSGELAKHVPACTPQMANSVRADLVQQLAMRVRLEQWDSVDAKALVMLYLCMPPDRLDEDIIRRTLYLLRRDLAQPEAFRPVKRYESIPLGRKNAARRSPHVSAHRK